MRRAMSVFAALIMIAASGCDDSEPGPTLPPKTSPTSSSSVPTTPRKSPTPTVTRPTVPADVPITGRNVKPGEKPPVMPVAALQHNSTGATEFAKFFIQTVDWAYATMSTTYMKHYYEPSCVYCVGTQQRLDDGRRTGQFVRGNRFVIKRAEATHAIGGPSGAETSVVVVSDVTAGNVFDAAGKFVQAAPPISDLTLDVWLSWKDGRWLAVDLVART